MVHGNPMQRPARRKHHDLQVWQEAMHLVKEIYRVTSSFPKEEMYALVGQMRRAAVSIPCNIAEDSARTGNRELLQFLSIARDSLSELETQVYIAKELNYLSNEAELLIKIDKIFGLIGGLMKSIRARETK